MDNFDSYRNDGPVEYVVKTGDPSRGASHRDEYVTFDDGVVYEERSAGRFGVVGLTLALVFLAAAIFVNL